jgi:hypothetical protein
LLVRLLILRLGRSLLDCRQLSPAHGAGFRPICVLTSTIWTCCQ